jgi:hypothetical protein
MNETLEAKIENSMYKKLVSQPPYSAKTELHSCAYLTATHRVIQRKLNRSAKKHDSCSLKDSFETAYAQGLGFTMIH